ncbi:hypothetical protein L596_015145 [Steinernema carpocapsae]|uniref:Uncharacterized protein n=1 Tax=Steinernema carpocapsae TaxID=34508 RepID=A0A4U5NF07_STECR|nr:hypothetical protein L596_015145 [Steinernema carpocapsae]
MLGTGFGSAFSFSQQFLVPPWIKFRAFSSFPPFVIFLSKTARRSSFSPQKRSFTKLRVYLRKTATS